MSSPRQVIRRASGSAVPVPPVTSDRDTTGHGTLMSSRFPETPPSLTELLHTFGLLPPEKTAGSTPAAASPSAAAPPGRTDTEAAPSRPETAGTGISGTNVSGDRRFFTTPEAFSDWLVQLVTAEGAADIHLSAAGVRLRRHDSLLLPARPVTWDDRDAETVLEWLTARFVPASALAERFWKRLRDTGTAVTTWTAGNCRFRVNVFYTGGQMAFVFRHIPPGVRDFSHLSLPPVLLTWLLESTREGLLLFSGPSGSGKSTTLSACINFWNDTLPQHIVVIEDPMEYFYESRTALIHQLEVGTDISSMGEALRHALWQSPRILVVGEIRDAETARLVLQAAESGCLVAATMNAPHTFGALQQFAAFFPETDQPAIWKRLVRAFSAVLGQILLPAASVPAVPPTGSPIGGTSNGFVAAAGPGSGETSVGDETSRRARLPAVEVLRRSPAMAHLLEAPHCTQELVLECMERSRSEYMITMDDYLYLLLVTGRIELETALARAHSPSDLKLRMAARRETTCFPPPSD